MMDMSQRAEEIRKRIARRKKERQQHLSPNIGSKNSKRPPYFVREEEKHGIGPFDSYDGGEGSSNGHPLFQKEWFMLKILASACLILIVAILYKDGTGKFQAAQHFVTKTMETEFQFATVSSWYEKQFGKPLALIPTGKEQKVESTPIDYAIPVTGGRILENFQTNGQGIMVETGLNNFVEAMNEGNVIYFGGKENIGGITVVIQHSDGSESWYGNLETVNVNLYDFVEKGSKVGKATENETGDNGTFYFAIKKGDTFIDPIQVINFD
jgi:stage IV sporulation protein FA